MVTKGLEPSGLLLMVPVDGSTLIDHDMGRFNADNSILYNFIYFTRAVL